jgi:hypothetical protein
MRHSEIIAVCSEHINRLCGQNVEFVGRKANSPNCEKRLLTASVSVCPHGITALPLDGSLFFFFFFAKFDIWRFFEGRVGLYFVEMWPEWRIRDICALCTLMVIYIGIILRMWIVSDSICRVSQSTHFTCGFSTNLTHFFHFFQVFIFPLEKSASSWLKPHNCLRMHGQQNIKFHTFYVR